MSSVVRTAALRLANTLGVILEAAQQRDAQPALVRTAIRRRDGVTVGGDVTVVMRVPRHRPFAGAVALLVELPGEHLVQHHRLALDLAGKIIRETAGKAQHGLFGDLPGHGQEFGRAGPADLDAAKQIGLGAGHAVEPRGLEMRAGLENLRIGLETHLGAAPVAHRANVLQRPLRHTAREAHPVELLVARDLDLDEFRKRIHDRDADAVQAAGSLVSLAVELAARVQRAHHDFQRGFRRVRAMRIDRDAAAVVRHREIPFRIEFDVDEGRVAGDGLVHRVVEHLGEEVVQRLLVRPADIHAGAAADGFQPFENLDRRAVIIACRRDLGRCRNGVRRGGGRGNHSIRFGIRRCGFHACGGLRLLLAHHLLRGLFKLSEEIAGGGRV